MYNNRRNWIKQAGLSVAGFTFFNPLSADTIYQGDFSSRGLIKPIRLTSNENPYGPSPLARKAMADAIAGSNRYPWDNTNALREKLGNRFGLNAAYTVVGAGSSELLGLVGQMVSRDKSHFVSADLTFRIWRRAAIDSGATLTRVALTDDKRHDLPAMEAAIQNNTKLIYICNPNNPTGTIIDSNTLKNFIEEHSKKYFVVIDEAYLEYTQEPSMASLVTGNKNIIVIKTFSKIFGLAGARIGYALAHPDTIKVLNELQPWPNAGASACAIAAASATLDDQNFLRSTVEKNNKEKQALYAFYKSMNIPYVESHTNFVYYSINRYNGDFAKEMEKRDILCGGITEEKDKWTRITVGTEHEMNQYRKIVKQIIS